MEETLENYGLIWLMRKEEQDDNFREKTWKQSSRS